MKLCLGTVQFGMRYGIASQGRPDPLQVSKMLRYAAGHGVDMLDTAAAYGDAEGLLGDLLVEDMRGCFSIVTKIPGGVLDNLPASGYAAALSQSMAASLERLRMDSVYACLYHNAEYAENEQALSALAKLKESGKVKKTGVSIYTPREFELAAASPYVDIIQIPYNILDIRLDAMLDGCGKEIHARSAYLQGLLLMPSSEIPGHLSALVPYAQRFERLCRDLQISKTQALLGFMKTQPHISHVVFGADDLAQLRQTISDFDTATDGGALRAFAQSCAGIDERLIMPNCWQALKEAE